MIITSAAIVAIFGLIIGSFLNVVILRYGTGLPISKGRSRCFACDHELSWRELIPLFSYLIQLGRCRHCRSRISIQYPLVEALTSALFVLSFFEMSRLGFSTPLLFCTFAALIVLMAVYVVIVTYDLRHKMIPDIFSYAAALIALVFVSIAAPNTLLMHLAAGAGAFLFFSAFWLLSRGKWMGLGDGKLALSVGFLLGPSSTVVAVLMAFWSGALVSLALLGREKIVSAKLGLSMKSEIPFAPFIILGALLAFFMHINLGTLGSWLTI